LGGLKGEQKEKMVRTGGGERGSGGMLANFLKKSEGGGGPGEKGSRRQEGTRRRGVKQKPFVEAKSRGEHLWRWGEQRSARYESSDGTETV